ncbi:hypothetical protein OIU77_012043 [Salix suchowensis]|uniref:GDT1 family protein n=1 Tax=Salix suchowensis TaxID=1278906 RepID=A0ABQ9A2C3_9ROSI|nr:hypothetical protein OIU77_012043 [Salix suchowensis]
MRHPRRLVLSGCLSALIVMTIISAVVGWAAPNLISRTWTHHLTTILFFGFGLWSLWDGFNDKGEAVELAEVEAKLVCFFPVIAFTFKWNHSSHCLYFITRMLIGKRPKVVARTMTT